MTDRSARRRNLPTATLSTTNRTWTGLWSNLGLCGDRPAGTCLSHGTALYYSTLESLITGHLTSTMTWCPFTTSSSVNLDNGWSEHSKSSAHVQPVLKCKYHLEVVFYSWHHHKRLFEALHKSQKLVSQGLKKHLLQIPFSLGYKSQWTQKYNILLQGHSQH